MNWAKWNTVDEFHQPGKILSLERRLEVGITSRQIHNLSYLLFILRAFASCLKFTGSPLRGLQQDVNQELPDVQGEFRKDRGTRDQIANIHQTIEKQGNLKNVYFCFVDYAKTYGHVDQNKLWNILKKMEISDHFTCLLRNPYAGQEATVRTRHGTKDCFQIGKGVRQGCMLSPCLFNLCAEYIMWNAGLDESQAGIMQNAGLDESQAGIKFAGWNITTLDVQMVPL